LSVDTIRKAWFDQRVISADQG